MSHVLNKDFKTTYPERTVDHIKFKDKEKLFEKEWDFYDFYNQRNIMYFKHNKKEFVENFIIDIQIYEDH